MTAIGKGAPAEKSGDRPRPALRPRDAASLVVVDRSRPTPSVLMGRRRPDQVFLPNTFVFPGGRVELADRTLARRHALDPADAACLKIDMSGRPSETRAAALALAAIRETFEETGIIVGEAGSAEEAAGPGAWQGFLAEGYRPRPDRLAFFARAITPPGRPRRYDTRFFIVDAGEIAHRTARVDGELLDIDWYPIDRIASLALPSITRHVLADLVALVERGQDASVPFYTQRRGRFARTLLPRAHSAA